MCDVTSVFKHSVCAFSVYTSQTFLESNSQKLGYADDGVIAARQNNMYVLQRNLTRDLATKGIINSQMEAKVPIQQKRKFVVSS